MTLSQTEMPDQIENEMPPRCASRAEPLSAVEIEGELQRWRVFDLPPLPSVDGTKH